MLSINITMLSDSFRGSSESKKHSHMAKRLVDAAPALHAGQALSERVYVQLRAMIKGVQREAKLPGELEMARRFGVSRPVLRQALERLRAEGFVYSHKGSGNFVGEPRQAVAFGPLTGIPDVRSFLEFRCNLESEMAALAAEHHSRADLLRIRETRKRLEQAIASGRPGIEEDIAFHTAVAHTSGNRFYAMTLAALAEQTRYSVRLIRELSGQPALARRANVRGEHAAIEAAIASGDTAAAAAAMKAHLRGGIARLFGSGA